MPHVILSAVLILILVVCLVLFARSEWKAGTSDWSVRITLLIAIIVALVGLLELSGIPIVSAAVTMLSTVFTQTSGT